jgi:hypothetical protein
VTSDADSRLFQNVGNNLLDSRLHIPQYKEDIRVTEWFVGCIKIISFSSMLLGFALTVKATFTTNHVIIP